MPAAPKNKIPSPQATALQPGQPHHHLRILFLGALLLVAVVFGAFLNGLSAPYLLDDNDSILSNPSIRSFSTALTPPLQNGITVSGRPVLNLSFAINYAFSKTDAEGIRLGNILIHAFAALALWGLVRRTLLQPVFGQRFATDAAWLAWLVAALWAVHPMQAESVTYAVQRAESLVGLFYLTTLSCFIRFSEARSPFWFAASFCACLLGMGAKEVMASAPFIVFLYDRTFVSGTFRAAWQRHRKIHLALGSTLVLLAVLVFQARSRGGSVGADATVTHWGYLCTQAYAVMRYLWLALWPANLTFDYGRLIVSDPAVFIPCGLFVLGLLAASIWAMARRPALGFSGAWFFAILAPSSSIIPVNTQTVAEHRMYLPLAAVILAVALLTHKILRRRSWIVLAVLIVPAVATTVARNRVYLNDISIWQDTVTKQPANHRAWVSLGALRLHKDKNPAAALEDFKRALALAPNDPRGLVCIGQALVKLGRFEEGLPFAEKANQLDPANPSIAAGVGVTLMDAGFHERAIPLFQKALEPDPTSSTLNYNLANSLMKLGRDAEAEQHFRVAIESSPSDIDALNNLGTLLRRSGRVSEAVGFYERALELSPQSSKTHNNLGIACMMLGRIDEGLGHLRESVKLEPQSFESRSNLAQALAQIGKIEEAIPLCESLVQEKPSAELYNNLGALYGQTGQLEKAEQAFCSAAQIDSANTNARENLEKLRSYFESQRRR